MGAFSQEKALLGAFSLIVKPDCETDGSSAALIQILLNCGQESEVKVKLTEAENVKLNIREDCEFIITIFPYFLIKSINNELVTT